MKYTQGECDINGSGQLKAFYSLIQGHNFDDKSSNIFTASLLDLVLIGHLIVSNYCKMYSILLICLEIRFYLISTAFDYLMQGHDCGDKASNIFTSISDPLQLSDCPKLLLRHVITTRVLLAMLLFNSAVAI